MSLILDGSAGITTPMYNGTISANTVTPSVNMKNRIINGAMVIDQRNAGASVSPNSGAYTLDRWVVAASQASKFSIQQNAGSVTPPAGFTNYLGCTSASAYSVGASENFEMQQRIEGYNMADLSWGTANAKTVTLSFWVRSSLTGTFGGFLCNDGGSYSYPFSYTISAANTWEQKTITITGATGGTWLTTTGVGIYVAFSLGAGSSTVGTAGSWYNGTLYRGVTGQQQVVSTNGATWYVTGVQLEVGSSATSFDYRPYGTEVQLCQRYFCKSWAIGTAPANASSSGEIAALWGGPDTSTLQMANTCFPVTMRANPTVTFYSGSQPAGSQANGCWSYYISGGFRNTVAPITATLTPQYMGVYSYGSQAVAPSVGSSYIGGGCYTASAEL